MRPGMVYTTDNEGRVAGALAVPSFLPVRRAPALERHPAVARSRGFFSRPKGGNPRMPGPRREHCVWRRRWEALRTWVDHREARLSTHPADRHVDVCWLRDYVCYELMRTVKGRCNHDRPPLPLAFRPRQAGKGGFR